MERRVLSYLMVLLKVRVRTILQQHLYQSHVLNLDSVLEGLLLILYLHAEVSDQ